MLDLLIPRNEGENFMELGTSLAVRDTLQTSVFISLILELGKDKMTVGKIYVCLLILESWRTTRFGQIESTGQVSLSLVTVRV